ncbi:MAK10-like protein, partial [Tanacetum coccineum]
ESTIPLNEIISQIPPSIAITPVLPIEDPKDSLIMGDENLSTIPEKEPDEFIKFSVKDLVLIPSDDDESLSEKDVLKENFKIYSNPLFEFDDEYISSDVNPLLNEVFEDIESEDSYVSKLNEPDLLVTPLSKLNKDECFDPRGDFILEDDALSKSSITTWDDVTTRFLAQFFPPGRTTKLRNDILMFQQHHGESLSEAWTRFKDLLQKVPRYGINLWLQVQIFYDHVNPVTRRTIDQSAGGKLRDRNAKESWALLEDLALYDNESWNDPRDFVKPVKAIALPQDVSSTSDRCLIELKNQVQRLMEASLAPTQPTQVNKVTTSCEICSGPHDTLYCKEYPEQAFVEYASSRTHEAGGKWYTFKPEQNNLGDTYNPSWRSYPNLRWRQCHTPPRRKHEA